MLIILLRIIGTTSGLAILAVLMPHAWMNDIHIWLGMGALPAEPIVGYLTRSLSAFYALLGALLWYLSFYPVTHRPVIRFLGFAMIAFGVILLAIDWSVGMPFYWALLEGPIAVAYGMLILMLTKAPEAPAE